MVSASPPIAQVALCSDDLVATVRLYTEVLGFAQAGGRAMWGSRVAGIQGLGEDTRFTLWWLVGRQDFFQLEIFQHTLPPQRPQRPDARPSDLGWTRLGVAVPDFDAVLARLADAGVPTLTDPVVVDGLRRVCFRDPQVGAVVEILEDGEALPGGLRQRFYDLEPALVSVTVSVADLDEARRLYVDELGLEELPLRTLHDEDSEALWGLEGAVREGFVARGADRFLEVVRYVEPTPRPRPPGARLSDQGIMNAAIGFRRRDDVVAACDRATAGGHPPSLALSPSGAAYLDDGQGGTVEVLAVDRELDAAMGFVPAPVFPPPPAWPRAAVAPAVAGRPSTTGAAEAPQEIA